MNTMKQSIKEKRQYFHQLLLRLGEVKYKEVIVESEFGVSSTRDLNHGQMDKLIADALNRMNQNSHKKPATKANTEKQIRHWRSKVLLVLGERGIKATKRDWSVINEELSKKQYQWISSGNQINTKGLYAFRTVQDLKKLFKQLCSIRDNEQKKAEELKQLASLN